MKKYIVKIQKNWFLFEELVKRDFKKKYKRTMLGMLWSILSPLLTLLIMKLVFTQFFGRSTPHYTIYIFAGNIIMSYYREATRTSMMALRVNAPIITKINVPKYLFVFSKITSSFINFLLTVGVFFVFCLFDNIVFSWRFLLLIYPIICVSMLNVGVSMILSCMYVFFTDTTYLYEVFLTLLQYVSAIFYSIDGLSQNLQRMFLLNPVYVMIKYFRIIVIDGNIPSLEYHFLCLFYGAFFMFLGFMMYKKYNTQFIYYL